MSALEVRGAADGLLDAAFAGLGVRGLGGATEDVVWRAKLRDDDGRVWKASAAEAAGLSAAWGPAKRSGAPAVAALGSLRPVALDVRAELPDGRAAARTLVRRVQAEGVQVRRWRGGLAATLHRPAAAPCATVVVDAADAVAHVTVAASLLASRGALVLVVTKGVDPALELLAAVPGAGEPVRLTAAGLPLPPGVPAVERAPADPWDALLARVGAVPR